MNKFQKYIHIKYELDRIQGSEDSVLNKLGKIPAFKEKFQKGEKPSNKRTCDGTQCYKEIKIGFQGSAGVEEVTLDGRVIKEFQGK